MAAPAYQYYLPEPSARTEPNRSRIDTWTLQDNRPDRHQLLQAIGVDFQIDIGTHQNLYAQI